MDNLLESVENIKEKLTSEEYKSIMESLQKVNKEVKPMKIFDIFYPTCVIIKEDGYINVKPDLKRITLSQSELDLGRGGLNNSDSDLHEFPYFALFDKLSAFNKQIFRDIDRCKTYNLSISPDDPDIIYDIDNTTVYVRLNNQEFSQGWHVR